jgi:hypothetical protein
MIITTPTNAWLQSAIAECRHSIAVASPYVGDYLWKTVAELDGGISVALLTRTLLTDFASNASDLDAVRKIAERAGTVLSLSSLHAKVYLVDARKALITSANATASGMFRNRECGYEVGRKHARNLKSLILTGFGSSPQPQPWTAEQLDELREPVERLRAALPRTARIEAQAIEQPPRVELGKRAYSRVVESFAGWLRLTIEGLSQIRSDVFTMDDVLAACAPLAAAQFPENRHVREKLRQQMQRLRDLGMVLFHGSGRYELLTKPR